MGVVAILFAAIDKMVCGRIVCHESEWIFITGIRQFTSLQNADDGYAEIVNLWIELQPIIGLSLLIIVVQVRVPRIPTLRWEVCPSFEMQLDLNCPFCGHRNNFPKGFVFRATLNDNICRTAGHVHGKLTRTVEKTGRPVQSSRYY